MSFVFLGVDHRTAPVEVREALAFDEGQARHFLAEGATGLPERLLLSTCNRTEVYAVPRSAEEDPVPWILEYLRRARGMDLAERGPVPTVFRGESAVRRLLRVACGLESMVLGESQILGQVKAAGDLAQACGSVGPILHRALSTAVRVAKRARSETRIGEGAVSVASAAVELARRVFGDLEERSALVVGAGETGRLVAQHLRGAGIGGLTVANRTLGRARELAETVGAKPWGLCGIPPALREADIVVTSTSAAEPLLTYEEVKAAMRARKSRLLLVLDIAVPRDVDVRVRGLEGLFLHDIDALNSIVDGNLEVRRKAVPEVEAMVEDAVRSFAAWERGLSVVPSIKALRGRFEEIRAEELAKNLKRVPEEARESAERLTASLLNRLLHQPTSRLRSSVQEPGAGKDLVAALRELFDLPEQDHEED